MDEENYTDETKYPDYRLQAIINIATKDSPNAIRASKELNRRQNERDDHKQQTQIDIKKIAIAALIMSVVSIVVAALQFFDCFHRP